jgi:hypothetical protein
MLRVFMSIDKRKGYAAKTNGSAHIEGCEGVLRLSKNTVLMSKLVRRVKIIPIPIPSSE